MAHPERGATAPLLSSDTASTLGPASSRSSSFSSLNDGRALSPRSKAARRAASARRAISFAAAVVAALCGGSITVFSMYGRIFQERLHYNQFQVNGLAISSSIALYLPVSLLGYVCDRVGTAPLSGLAAVLFGVGYGLAAGIYRHLERRLGRLDNALGENAKEDWSYPLIVLAFVFIGVGTCAMYLASVATCAKNFGRGKHRGLALAVPIASFGLSGMWLSQVGSRLFCERRGDGSAGDLDVFRFFIFLAVLLSAVGVLAVFTLKVVDEDELIDAAVEELERSGLLDGSSLLGGSRTGQAQTGYGTLGNSILVEANDEEDEAGILDPSKDLEDDPNWKKNWVLNAETRRFLSDHTMWCLAFGFLLMIGPGEAFINNLGTIIGTLYRAAPSELGVVPTSAATHVSIVGITSTAARLLTGSLTDLLAPSPATQHLQFAPAGSVPPPRRFQVSRVVFLLFFGLVLSVGLVALASGLIQDHAGRFWIVSGFAGAGYGAVFSLTPIIITVIWGVENFATNWGIVATFPALGATFWGLVYSAVYQAGARREGSPGGGNDGGDDDLFCHGRQCYAPTFWAMAGTVWVACLLVLWAWKGPNGWARRGIVI